MSAIQQGLLASYALGNSPISLLAHTIKQAPNNPTTNAIDTSGASLLIACVNCITGPAVITDSKAGNVWVGLTLRNGSTIPTSQIWYVKNPTVGTLHTFTATASFASIGILAFNHTNTGANADGDTGSDQNAATAAPGSITPSQDNSVVVTMLGSANTDGQVSHTINGGFTLVDDVLGVAASGFSGLATAYLIQTTAAAANPTWTQTGGALGGISVAMTSFKHS